MVRHKLHQQRHQLGRVRPAGRVLRRLLLAHRSLALAVAGEARGATLAEQGEPAGAVRAEAHRALPIPGQLTPEAVEAVEVTPTEPRAREAQARSSSRFAQGHP